MTIVDVLLVVELKEAELAVEISVADLPALDESDWNPPFGVGFIPKIQ